MLRESHRLPWDPNGEGPGGVDKFLLAVRGAIHIFEHRLVRGERGERVAERDRARKQQAGCPCKNQPLASPTDPASWPTSLDDLPSQLDFPSLSTGLIGARAR